MHIQTKILSVRLIATFVLSTLISLTVSVGQGEAQKKPKAAPKTTLLQVGTTTKERDAWVNEELEKAKREGANKKQLKQLKSYLKEAYSNFGVGAPIQGLDRALHEICPCLYIRIIGKEGEAKKSGYARGSVIVRRPDNMEGIPKSVIKSDLEKDIAQKEKDFCDCYKLYPAGCNLIWSLAHHPKNKTTKIWKGKTADNPGQSGRKGENIHRHGNVSWNPKDSKSDPSTTGQVRRPPSIGLGHELGHALHEASGTKGSGPPEEVQTSKGENQLRAERHAAAKRQLEGKEAFQKFTNPKKTLKETHPRSVYRIKDKDSKEVIPHKIPAGKDIRDDLFIKKAKKVAMLIPGTPWLQDETPGEGTRVAIQDHEKCVATIYSITETYRSKEQLISVALTPEPAIHIVPEDNPGSTPPGEDLPICITPKQPEARTPAPQSTPNPEPTAKQDEEEEPEEAEEPEDIPDLGLVKAQEAVVSLALSTENVGEAVEEVTLKILTEVPDLPMADGSDRTHDEIEAYQPGVTAVALDDHGEATIAFVGAEDQSEGESESDEISLVALSEGDGLNTDGNLVATNAERKLPIIRPDPQLVIASKGQNQSLPASLAPAGAQVCIKRGFPIGETNVFVVSVPENVLEPFIERVKASDTVEFIEPDPCRDKEQVRDPHFKGSGLWGQKFDNQWAIKRAGLGGEKGSVWSNPDTALKPVTVAIIDTGLDWRHPDLPASALWRNPGELPGNGLDDDKNGYVDDIIGWDFISNSNKPWDHDGHGTFVAGVIAAGHNEHGIAGVNPAAKIMVLRALDAFGRGHASMVAQAIAYAADQGAQVINLSLGGRTLTNVERLAIEHARAKGALVVAAAGNSAKAVKEFAPAGIPGVITVSATDRNNQRAGFSNWGPLIDIAAPGVDVLSLRARRTDLLSFIKDVNYSLGAGIVGPDRAYYRASGTSFAAPIVSGALSLILSARPELTPDQAKQMLLHSARDIDTPGNDGFSGYGLIDIKAALAADPNYYLESRITGVKVVTRSGKPVLQVIGSASADQFKVATILLSRAQAPNKWLKVNRPINKTIENGVLIELPAKLLGKTKQWTLRLVTEHATGKKREARFKLKLQ